MTKISAAERVGLVFLFIILAQHDEGREILNDALNDALIDCRTGGGANLNDILHVFEAMICFDAWLNQSTFWSHANAPAAMASAKHSIQILMKLCKRHIPTHLKPDRWKFPKFHEMLHVVDDITRFGSPTNFCAQRPESLLIHAAKRPGRRAQKRHAGTRYELQAAQRLSYSLMINAVYSRIHDDVSEEQSKKMIQVHDEKEEAIQHSTGAATFGKVDRVGKSFEVFWRTTTDVNRMHLPPPLLEYICSQYGDSVNICTEYVRDSLTFRCHPCYHSDGPIYDWMKVVFEEGVYPCRLAMVVITSNAEEPYHLIVQSALKATKRQSTLLKEWDMSNIYYSISPDTIEGPCFVISIKEDDSKVLETLPYEEWPAQFSTAVDDEDDKQ